MRIEHDGLTPEIYERLRDTVGFTYYHPDDVKKALQGGLFSIVIFDGDYPVACARIVGDGRIAFFVKDVVVDPQYRQQGLGCVLMKEIDTYLQKNACKDAYVGLMSTPGMEGFYEKFNFVRRPNESQGAGMIKFYSKK